jgi:hypothetical protein
MFGMSMPPPTGTREFRDDVVRIGALTVNTTVLDGLTFQNCRIIGPAILVPQGSTSIVHCGWDAPDFAAVFWELDPSRTVVIGAIAVLNCTFSSCTFSGIGVAGPPELRTLFEEAAT